MNEREKLDWAYQERRLLQLLATKQALPADCPSSTAELDKEIAAIEELLMSYWLQFSAERLHRP